MAGNGITLHTQTTFYTMELDSLFKNFHTSGNPQLGTTDILKRDLIKTNGHLLRYDCFIKNNINGKLEGTVR